jgi:hypothetical protein
MTRKETLLARKYELQNELRILRGEEPYDLAERTSDWKFRQTAKEEREYTLKADIERLEAAIAKQKVDNERNAKTAAYYATEEGAAHKAQLENEKEIQIGAYNEYSNSTIEAMKSWIKEFLGEHWTVKFMSDNCIEFAVWNAETGKFAFGQEINIRAEKHDYLNNSKELFETNIGSTGSFGLTEQEVGDRARYYIDLGKFLSDTTKLAQLKNRMFLFAETLEDIRDCVRRLNAELENPLGL